MSSRTRTLVRWALRVGRATCWIAGLPAMGAGPLGPQVSQLLLGVVLGAAARLFDDPVLWRRMPPIEWPCRAGWLDLPLRALPADIADLLRRSVRRSPSKEEPCNEESDS
jgi:hypothetical protein